MPWSLCWGQPSVASVSPEPIHALGHRHEKQPLAERKQLLDSPALGPGGGALLSSTDASSVSPVSALGYGDYRGRSQRRRSLEGDTLELARQRRASSGYDASTSGQSTGGKGLFSMDWGWLSKSKQTKQSKRAIKGHEDALERPSRGDRRKDGSINTAELLQRR